MAMVLPSHLVGRIVATPKPSHRNPLAPLDHPARIVMRFEAYEVVIPRSLGPLRYITESWTPMARMPAGHLGHVSLNCLDIIGAGPNCSEMIFLCLLGVLGWIVGLRGHAALPPGVHRGNVLFVLITAIARRVAIAKRVYPLQAQSNMLRRRLSAPSIL